MSDSKLGIQTLKLGKVKPIPQLAEKAAKKVMSVRAAAPPPTKKVK